MSQYQIPRGVSHYRAIERALSSLRSCGCFSLWEEFTGKTIVSKTHLAECNRYDLCISEQCWSAHDVDEDTLSVNDKLLPFPEGARRSMFAKRTAARSLKQRALAEAAEAKTALQNRHSACRSGPRRCLDNVIEASRHIAEERYTTSMEEVKSEVNTLITDSPWQPHQ